jgi:hypothetical protein
VIGEEGFKDILLGFQIVGLAEVFTFSQAPADAIDQLFENKENVIHTEIYVNITLDPMAQLI